MQLQKKRFSKKTQKPTAAKLWADVEDRFVPAFAPWPSERVVYLWLLRQTRLAGRDTIRVSQRRLGVVIRMSATSLKLAFQRLAAKGAIQIREKDYLGHRIRVLLPGELRGVGQAEGPQLGLDVETVNYYQRANLREMIYARESHRCFYCGKKLKYTARGLDHVVPRLRGGGDSYRNLVACCMECNMLKGARSAARFMKVLQKFGAVSRRELPKRLAALQALRCGKLKPKFSAFRRLRIAA